MGGGAGELCHMYICQVHTATLCIAGHLRNPLIRQEPACVHICAGRHAEE